ncbi:MAG: LysM peptidoglycan-binding domain-containing protein [Chloroflexi bacterium]|nr:LysM peptidoglycan-binding domain-containing protein [Chloroflexota bacterium]
MNLVELLKFIPLIIGGFLAYHLIFKVKLPSQNLGSIITYFIGIMIVFFAVGLLIANFVPDFANDLLDVGTSGPKWQRFINSSEGVVDDAFPDSTNPTGPTAVPTTVQVIITSTPIPGSTSAGQSETENLPSNGPTTYTVVQGDTLNKISRNFDVTLDALRQANGIPANTDLIKVGDQLIIPAQ